MPDRLPHLRVDHVSIAVREMAPALAFFRRVLPIRMREAPRPGYDGQFTWADFFVGDRKLELIEPARAGSFVERFLARRGEGFHHLAIDVDRLDLLAERLAADGVKLVAGAEIPGGRKTAFIHPRYAHGVLIQFWQEPEFGGPRRR